MLRYILHRPIAVSMMTLSVIVVAMVFIKGIPISLLPEIAIPKIAVQVQAANVDARTLENTIVRPIRTQLLQVNNVKDIICRTRNGSAAIDIVLEYGSNINLSFVEVNEKLDQAMSSLPRDLKRPKVIKTTLSDLPIYEIAVVAKDSIRTSMKDLSIFCEKIILRRMEQMDEVAFVDMHGFTSPQVSIAPNEALLAAMGISESTLIQLINQNNLEIGNLILKQGAYEYNVQLTSRLATIDDIKKIVLSTGNQTFQLADVATVKYAERPRRGSYQYNGKSAIALTVRKQSDANNFDLKAKMDTLLTVFENDYPNISFKVVQDQSKILEASFDNLFTSLLYGLLFSSLIIFAFMRQWKMSVLIIIVVPVSLIFSLFLFYLLGITINIISLTGLILGVGLMIDNAIITIENIRQFHRVRTLADACVEGPAEIIAPIISSALTTCSVFLPLILLGGIAGALFYDQALSISIALSCSILVSYFLLPVLYFAIVKEDGLVKNDQIKESTFHKWHMRVIDRVHDYKYVVIIAFMSLSILGFFLLPKLKVESFPKTTVESLELSIDWNEQIGIQESELRLKKLYSDLRSDIKDIAIHIGELQYLVSSDEQNINESFAVINISPNDEVKIEEKIRKFFSSNYPRSLLSIKPSKTVIDRILNTESNPLLVAVSSNNQLEAPSFDKIKILLDTIKANKITVDPPAIQNNITLRIDKAKAAIYDVSLESIYFKLKSIFNENYITDLKSSEQFIPIYIAGYEGTKVIDKLNESTIANSQGSEISLREFVEWRVIENYKMIASDRNGEMIPLSFDTFQPRMVAKIVSLRKIFPNFQFALSGQHYDNQALFSELNYIFGIVIALLFLILAAQFESLILPFIVLLTIPVSLGGVLITFYLLGYSINLISLVGMIIMSGIVINDAILKVSMLKQATDSGMTIREAMHKASDRRIRAIVMTSLTTILALVPIFFTTGFGSEIQAPLALAVISGISIGTVTSILLIPSLYAVMGRVYKVTQ